MSSKLSYASHYERMSGNCTTHLASSIISSLSPPISPSSHILDLACGPGIVTSLIKHSQPSTQITAADLSPSMLAEVQSLVGSNHWTDVHIAELDVRALTPLADGTFTHVIANLGLPVPGNLDGGAAEAISEIHRVLRPGGVAVLSTWADRVWPAAFEAAAKTVRPESPPKNLMRLEPKFLSGSWLLGEMERVFGNRVELKCVETWTEAATLADMVGNMMLAKEMFFGGFDEAEMEKAREELEKELQKLGTFEGRWEGVRVGMRAWVACGWKRGEKEMVPC